MTGEREIAEVAARILRPWLDALKERNAKNASRTAGQLTFWRDGMLGDLEKLASGTQDKKVAASLRKKFEFSAPGVTKAMNELRALRTKLAPGPIAHQIDLILNHDRIGKGSIRESIQMLLRNIESGGGNEQSAAFAGEICNRIAALNGELQRLERMVR